jgi:hypothetical protein
MDTFLDAPSPNGSTIDDGDEDGGSNCILHKVVQETPQV